jgi:hypothetical protein
LARDFEILAARIATLLGQDSTLWALDPREGNPIKTTSLSFFPYSRAANRNLKQKLILKWLSPTFS